MQSDHRVPTINTTAMRQQHRKRSFSSGNFRKRDKQDLICVVCHAPAMGYNFDQITCESCKAFFRRNALNNGSKLKCRIGTNDCAITLETRKRCKYCRLKKCFDKGLRKEWIMSEDEKRTKKQKIEDNRRLRAMSQSLSILTSSPSSPSFASNRIPFQYCGADFEDTYDESSNEYLDCLDDDERLSITKIEEHYTHAVQLNISVIKGYDNPCLRNLGGFADVVNEPAQICTLRMITFFKLTLEFNSLHEEDRLELVKHNLITILYLHFCICTDVKTDIFHEPNTPNDFRYLASVLRSYSDNIYIKTMALADEIQKLCSYDHLIMKLVILITIFSKGADYIETPLIEPQKVFYAQNIFVDLLWKYLNVRFGGDRTASIFADLIFCCMKAHSLARETKDTIANKQYQSGDDLAPLMQSVFLTS